MTDEALQTADFTVTGPTEPLARALGATVEVIDVDADPALVERYDELVPVLVCDGVELSRYRLDAERVRSALASHGA